jgi:hypothetical protein
MSSRQTHPLFITPSAIIYRWGQSFVSSIVGNDNIFILLSIAAISVIGAIVLVVTYGDVLAAGGVVFVLAVVWITAYRIDWGFLVFVACVLLCDQLTIPGGVPIGFGKAYFENLQGISYLQNVGPAVMSPLELHFALLFLIWVLVIVVRRDTKLSHVYAWLPGLLFFGAITLSFMYGMRRGGEFLTALWELRAIVYFGLMYYFVPQVIQTEEQLKSLMWVCIISISFKAFQGIFRFVWLGFGFQGVPALTAHEDPVFFVTLFILLFGLSLFKGYHKQRRALLWLFIPLMMGFFVAQRRAAYASLAVCMVGFLVLIPREQRIKVFKVLVPAGLVFCLYLAAFWNSDSKFASPARLVRSSLWNDQQDAGERYLSNLYRVNERYNLAMTVRRAPLKGIGFGTKYDVPIPLANIEFSLREYIAHNEILWLFANLGAIGFFTFCFFFASFLCQGSSIFSRLRDPYLKAVCAVSVLAVLNQIVVSYYDLQLTYYRNMLYLGILTGLLPTLETLDKRSSPKLVSSH